MIEIGTYRTKQVRVKIGKQFQRLFDAGGSPVTKIVQQEVTRCTHGTLDGTFGRDRGRKLVVKLCAGDVICIWPKGTRQKYCIGIKDLFCTLIRNSVLKAQLEKARERKAKKQAARERRRLDYAERKLRET